MPRKVVRVVTPGTIVEQELLPGVANNYLVSIVVGEKKSGLAFIDITTGEFQVTEFTGRDVQEGILSEIARLRPAEIIYPSDLPIRLPENGYKTELPDWRFELSRCQALLMEHFEVSVLDGFGLGNKDFAVQAAGGIIQYLRDNQPAALQLVGRLAFYTKSEFMTLDAVTRRNLELTETIRGGTEDGALIHILDRTVTPMGKRLLQQWINKPLLENQTIDDRLTTVDYFVANGLFRSDIRQRLRRFSDLERLTNRVLGGSAQPRDLTAIRDTLVEIPGILNVLEEQDFNFDHYVGKISTCEEACELLMRAIDEESPSTLNHTGVIKRGYSAELDGVYESSNHAREWIASLERAEQERTGIKSLKVGYNKVFGYYIEVTKSNTNLVPDFYIRKQTLVNAERYITPEMKEYEAQVLTAEERIQELERRLFYTVCAQLSNYANQLLNSARSITRLDVIAAFAEIAIENNYTRPKISDEDRLMIRGGRHPVVEKYLKTERFVPNDVSFDLEERILIITGPNMSGKSTFLRQVALIILMAQIGCYVPAEEAEIGIVDRIFTRIGAQDEIHAGQSTFMVEMIETANILNHATKRSLLIFDEVGRGTSTYDGVSLAWAMVEYIHNHPSLHSKTLFATHYHELTELADYLPGVRNYNVAVSEADGDVVFLRTIVKGAADKSYGIHVAQLAGLPKPIIQRASDIIKNLELSSGSALRINPVETKQLTLFPETNPLLEELKNLDINSLTPIEALNILYEWVKTFSLDDK